MGHQQGPYKKTHEQTLKKIYKKDKHKGPYKKAHKYKA